MIGNELNSCHSQKMDLLQFKSLTQKHLKSVRIAQGRPPSEQEFWRNIRSCFPSYLRSEALGTVRSLLDELAVKALCNGEPFQPYDRVARALQWALNLSLDAEDASIIDWEGAVAIAVQCHLHYPPGILDELSNVSSSRAQLLSKSILGLRDLGYEVGVRERGLAFMTDAEWVRLQRSIDNEARKIGGRDLLRIVLTVIRPKYSAVTERFNLGRNFRSVTDHSDVHNPWAFAYQLALKHIDVPRVSSEIAEEPVQFFDLLRFAVGILDLEDGPLGVLFEQQRNVLWFTQRSLQFDLNFVLTQANSRHVLVFLKWIFSWPMFCERRMSGIRTQDVAKAAAYLLEAAPNAYAHTEWILPLSVAKATGLDLSIVEKILINVFSHKVGSINKNLLYPIEEKDVNSAFRPLLRTESSFLNGSIFEKLPRSTAARAIMNASLRWLEDASKKMAKSNDNEEIFNEELGKALEKFVLAQFQGRGIRTAHGKYKCTTYKGECDLVIENDTHIVFIEIKSKQLTREARSYDTDKAVMDIAAAVVFPLAQALQHHAYLIEQSTLNLISCDGEVKISLQGREVLKVAVCRGELLSLHDRPYLQHFLSAVFEKSIALDRQSEESTKDLEKIFDRFNNAAKIIQGGSKVGWSTFNDCWCFSLFQLMLILEDTSSANDFIHRLVNMQRIHSGDRDTYSLHELMRKIENNCDLPR